MSSDEAAEQGQGLETTRATPLTDDPAMVAGRYRIVRVLGRGGGGTVWLAVDEHLGRDVALKRVAGEADNDILVERGLREARTSAALGHENVVRVFDAFEHEGSPWIVMEYVPGPSLAQLLEDGRSLPQQQVARIGAQLATALAAAHALGILHRDVKPANVLLDESHEQAKLTDFGIARGEDDHQLTRTGLVSGTAAFFSPELAQGQDPAAASDVWALGATLYAAVEGRRPFPDAANAVAQLHTIVREEPLEPRRAGPLTPILAGMLQGDPERRWTAERAARALAEVAAGRELPEARRGTGPDRSAYRPTAPTPDPTAPRRPADRTAHQQVDPTAHHRPRPTPQPAPRRQAPQPVYRSTPRRSTGAILGWLMAIVLAALLGWLIWAFVSNGGLDGLGRDDGTTTSSSPAGTTGELGEQEAADAARAFYLTLVEDGLEAARPMLGPDAAIADDIAEGLTRIDWDNVTTQTNDDGSVTVSLDVDYRYGTTLYEQRETLVLERPEAGGAPVIVERTTTDPVITSG